MLSEEQKKTIRDAALGEAITAKVSIHDQIAAIRKQISALSTAGKVPLVDELSNLEAVVSNEKAKLTNGSATKPKTTGRKGS